MAAAIRKVYPHPQIVHRWCKWHVLKDTQTGIVAVYVNNKDFRDEFHKLVNNMMTIVEFNEGWTALIAKYNLQKNPFLTRAFEGREMWAKPFFKDTFCARMTSTQRSEGANFMVKIVVPRNSPLHDFVEQYDKLVVTPRSFPFFLL